MLKFILLVGRILVDEKNFYSFIDARLLYLLNEFGAKIDKRNYLAIKNNIIKNRKLSNDTVEELVIQISMVLMPAGFEKMILKYILPSIEFAKKHFLYPYDDALRTIETLVKKYRIGVIGTHESEYSKILKGYGMDKYINCCVFTHEKNNEPDTEIFGRILRAFSVRPCETLLVGDRLDKHVHLANKLGMVSIRLCTAMNKVQEPENQNEVPKLTIDRLDELTGDLKME
jgi:FMN phosphatase YigB (HAD superfamily)